MREFAVTLERRGGDVAVVSLTLTPMLCGQFLKPPQPATNRSDARARARLQGAREQATRAGSTGSCAHMRLTLAVLSRHRGADVVLYVPDADRLLPAAGHGFLNGVTVRPPRMPRSPRPARRYKKSDASCSNDPDIDGGALRHWQQLRVNQANFNVALTPIGGGRVSQRGPSYRATAAAAGARGRRANGAASLAGHQHRRSSGKSPVPIHALRSESGRAQRLGAEDAGRHAEDADSCTM